MFEEDAIPPQLDFFYGGEHLSENFIRAYNFLSLNDENIGFADFLCSERGRNIVLNNSLSIHVESGNIFYQNFYTNENFYRFLLAKQDETKSIVSKRISYSYSFEKYIQSYLPSFSIDDVEKYDLYSHKNATHLLYKFNDWGEFTEGEKLLIHHTAKTKDDFSLQTIENRDRQFLIEKLIHNIEFKDRYQNLTEKKPKIIETIENSYKVNRCVYQSLFSDIAKSFFEYIHSLDPDEIQELNSDLKANGWGV